MKKTLAPFLQFGLIALLVFIAYGPALNGKFIWDDYLLVKDNTLVTRLASIPSFFSGEVSSRPEGHTAFYRPLQMASYALDDRIWGLNPFGFHLGNILSHIFVAAALYGFIFFLFGRRTLAFLSALLFAVHPLHSEVVSYISGRADALAALFILLTLLFSLLEGPPPWALSLIVSLSYAVALCSKEYSLITPFLFLLTNAVRKKRPQDRKFLFPFLSLLFLSLFYIFLRLAVLKIPSSVVAPSTLLSRLPGACAALGSYVKLLLWPFGLHMEYGLRSFRFTDPPAVLGMICLCAMIFFIFKNRKDSNQKVAVFSTAWFLIALLPVLNLYPINAYMAEHWLYVPSIGFFLILARGLVWLQDSKKGKKIGLIAACFLVFSYSFLTIRQSGYWMNPVGFAEKTLQYTPQSWRLYNEIGTEYLQAGNNLKAVEAFQKAVSLNPAAVGIYRNLGQAYFSLGRADNALASYESALKIKPDDAQTYFELGTLYSRMGHKEQARAANAKALALNPRHIQASYNQGIYLAEQGEEEKAAEIFKHVIRDDPGYAKAYAALAGYYAQSGKTTELASLLSQAVNRKVDYAAAYYFTGNRLNASGDIKAAIRMYQKTLSIDPSSTDACIQLGNAYGALGNEKEAIRVFEEALRIDPNLGIAYHNLALIYSIRGNCDLARSYLQKARTLHFPVDAKISELIEACGK